MRHFLCCFEGGAMSAWIARAITSFVLLAIIGQPGIAENKRKILVVGNPGILASVSRKELAAIYLLRIAFWPNGQRIVPVNRGAANPLRIQFSQLILHEPPMALADYWNQMHFQGVNPPVIMDSNRAVVAFVRKVPGAIGYVSATTPTDGVKVLRRLP